MTVSSETFRWSYASTGGTTYPYTSKIIESSDLVVYAGGNLQVESTDYTVTGAGAVGGGNVVFTVAPSSGTSVLITRDGIEFTQETDYTENDAFPASSHEDALDKIVMLLQRVWDYVRRSIKVPITSSLTDLELPTPTASRIIGWNSTADGLANYTLTDASTLAVSDTGASLVQSTSSSHALSVLGMSNFFKSLIDDTSVSALRDSLQMTPYPIFNLKVVPSTLTSGLNVVANSSATFIDSANPVLIAIPGANGVNTLRTRSADYLSGNGLFVLADGANYWEKGSLASQVKDMWLYAIWDGTGIVFALGGYSGFGTVPTTTDPLRDDYFLLEYGSTYTRDANHFCVPVCRVRYTYATADTPDYTVASSGENAPFVQWAPKSDYTKTTALATTITVAGNIAEDGLVSFTLNQAGRYLLIGKGSISASSTNINGILRLKYGSATYASATAAAQGLMYDAVASQVVETSVFDVVSISNASNYNAVHLGASCSADGGNRQIYGNDTIFRGLSLTCVRLD